LEERWTVRFQASTRRLFIIAEGFATEEKSKEAAREFIELLGTQTVDLVVDLGKMTGYTSGARRAWQEAFYPVRKQLKRMLVVGNAVPAMVRMGATVVAAVIGVPISFYKAVEEIDGPGARGRTA
jgi:hypothetical protein